MIKLNTEIEIEPNELDYKKIQQLRDYNLSFESLKKLNGNKFVLNEFFFIEKMESLKIKDYGKEG